MTRNIQATDAQGNKVSEPVQINGVDPTSSGGGGAFEDGDGDGIYTLPNAGDGIDVGPVDADNLSLAGNSISAILEAESAGTREEHGTVNLADPGTATDGSWETFSGSSTAVTFGTAFGASPQVVSNQPHQYGLLKTYNVSTTGFDSQWLIYRSDASTGTSGYWAAIGSE